MGIKETGVTIDQNFKLYWEIQTVAKVGSMNLFCVIVFIAFHLCFPPTSLLSTFRFI